LFPAFSVATAIRTYCPGARFLSGVQSNEYGKDASDSILVPFEEEHDILDAGAVRITGAVAVMVTFVPRRMD
jgi:hypothetical protein